MNTACLDGEGCSQCVPRVITTFLHHIARCIAGSWNKTDACSLGCTESEVDKWGVGAKLYINKFKVLPSEFESSKVVTGVMKKDTIHMHLWKDNLYL